MYLAVCCGGEAKAEPFLSEKRTNTFLLRPNAFALVSLPLSSCIFIAYVSRDLLPPGNTGLEGHVLYGMHWEETQMGLNTSVLDCRCLAPCSGVRGVHRTCSRSRHLAPLVPPSRLALEQPARVTALAFCLFPSQSYSEKAIQGCESLTLCFLIVLGLWCVLLRAQAKQSADSCELCEHDLLPGALSWRFRVVGLGGS